MQLTVQRFPIVLVLVARSLDIRMVGDIGNISLISLLYLLLCFLQAAPGISSMYLQIDPESGLALPTLFMITLFQYVKQMFVLARQTDVTDVCPNSAALAQQLTHIELERLSFIGPEEFVQAFAKDNPHLETSYKDMKKTRNLESYVTWFNRLSYFVATEVVKVRGLSSGSFL